MMNLQQFFLLVSLSALCATSFAADSASASNAIMKSTPEPSQYLGQIILSLVFVLLLIFLAAWLLKGFSKYPGAASGHLRILGALSVGQKEKILLLQVGKEQIVVGVTTSEIRLVHQLSETVEVEDYKPVSVINSAFSKRLQDALNSRKTDAQS